LEVSANLARHKKPLVHLIRGAQMLPMLGREVVEGEQRVAILGQALDRLVVFEAPGFEEGVEGCQRILLGLGLDCSEISGGYFC
jgi:hypothetical protein